MTNQIFVAISIALVASVLVTGLASTIYAQTNMTGGNMPGATSTDGGDGGNDDGDDDDDGGDGGIDKDGSN
jgi:hypothetical protein